MKKFLLALFIVSFAATAQAQLAPQEGFEEFDNLEAIEIESVTLRSVNVSFIGPKKEGKLKGIIMAPSPLRRAKKVILEVMDPNQAVLVSEEINGKDHWGRVLRHHEFEIDLPENGVAEKSVLKVSVYSGSQVLAFGERELPSLDRKPSYKIEGFEVTPKDSKVEISFSLTNNTLGSTKAIPKLTLKSLSNAALKPSESFLGGQTVGPKSEKKFLYEIDVPKDSGLYEISIEPLSSDKRSLAGALRDSFVVGEGFGMISKFSLNPVLDNDDFNYELVLEGVSDKDLGRLEVDLSALQGGSGVKKNISQTQVFASSPQGFSVNIPLNLENKVSDFSGEVSIDSPEGVIALRKFSFQVDQLNELGQVVAVENPEILEPEKLSKPFLLIVLLVILFIVVFVVWFFWRSFKKKKSSHLLILFLALGIWHSASAELLKNLWHHPLPGWTYNPSPEAQFDKFNLINFRGNVFNSLTQKGLFQVAPTRIVVKFNRENGHRLYVESFDYEVEEKKTYKFDLSVPESLDEGAWGVKVYFLLEGTWYVTTWVEEGTGNPNVIYIDKTPPSIEEARLDEQTYLPAERLIRSGIATLKQSRKSFLLNRSLKRRDNKEAYVAIANKERVRRNKIHLRNSKVDNLREKELQLDNLTTGTDPQPIQDEIDLLVSELNTLTTEINTLTNQLGRNIPSNSVFSTEDLTSHFDLTATLNGPASDLASNFSCPIVLGSTPLTTKHLSECLSSINQTINSVTSQIASRDAEIRTSTSRFKRLPIGVKLICDDALSGCYPACNPADEICDLECLENPSACALYQANSPVDYADNCSGDPLVCEVDCVEDPEVCRRGTFNFDIRGNFCGDLEYCDTDAPRDFQVCDNVGNCSTLSDAGVETDWYDPVKPDLNESLFIRNKGNIGGTETSIDGQGSDVLAADERITLQIDAIDPVNPTVAEHPTLFDENACGFGAEDDFFHADGADTFCTQSKVACALSSNIRGRLNQRIGGSCSGFCPEGYLLDANNLCVPQCDFRLFDGCFPFLLIGDTCETSIWLPIESAMPIGQSFVQTSNCGETRPAVGLKPLTESLNHFLDGRDAFGVFFYDTFEDDTEFSQLTYSPSFDLGTSGYEGSTSSTSAQASFSHESGFSPAGGNVLKIVSENLQGGHAAWSIDSISVEPNKDYIFTYWVRTNTSINKNAQGAWPKLTGNGSNTDIFTQYASTMEGVDGDLLWHRVEIPFTTPAGTTKINIELRLEAQNNRTVYFDDVKLFEKNWRYDSSKSWFSEPLDDQGDGICDYLLNDGDGDPRSGLDDRCGTQNFPEKVVVAFTSDGLYVFDAVKGTLWIVSRQDENPFSYGRMIFGSLLFGDSYALNGKLYSNFRFDQGGGKNGAVIIGDFINDTIYSHRMNSCFTMAGYKGAGTSPTAYFPPGCPQRAYTWGSYLNGDQASRNVSQYPWSTAMPANLQTATNQLNTMHAQIIGGKTYVALATNFGVTILNKTDNTNQHIEFDGHDSGNYFWNDTPNTANIYRRVHVAEDGKLYYLWDYSLDTRARVWVIDDITTLPYNGLILSGSSVRDYLIQPNNASTSYPTTALPDSATALDVNTQHSEFLIGSDSGAERFKGTFTLGNEHANLAKSRTTRLFSGARLYGQILGHWGSGLQDVGGRANDLSATGNVTVSAVATGADLQQLNFDGTGYLSSSAPDFNAAGNLTIGTWVHTESGVDDGGFILSKKDATNTDFAFYRTADDKLRVDGQTETNTNYKLTDWNFVVATWDGTEKKIYIDGQLVSAVPDTKTSFSGVGELQFGGQVGATDSDTRLNGSLSLPFIVNTAYAPAQVRSVYNSTRDWFEANTKITIQGTSDDVIDLAYGDNGSYFLATSSGVTHFDLGGRVIRTISAAPTTLTNIQIVTNDINSIDYENGWLILAYNARGIEIVNITREGKESLSRYDNSIYDPYYFY